MPDPSGVRPLIDKLNRLTHELASGSYRSSCVSELFEMTDPLKHPPPVPELAESIGLMLVKVEAREHQLEGTISDLSEAKSKLEEYSRRLEDMVRERTADLRKANERLEYLAGHDPLTGLANRRTFFSELDRRSAELAREGRPLSLVMADADFFKAFNDAYGHRAGDDCLRRLARVLDEAASKAGGLAARYGGEEFILLLPGLGGPQALALAEEMREGFLSLGIPHGKSSASPFATASFGVASAVPREGGGAIALIEAADQALYRAKRERGRNNCLLRED
jgi:diguanylate cyclase (GGDEF)-like protein